MKIYSYALTWNEEERLPWYLDHYSFVDRIFLYDQHSTDRTATIAKNDIRLSFSTFGGNTINELDYLVIKNNCWKNSEADWVIVGDVDELLWHPNLPELLRQTTATILRPGKVYHMISEESHQDYRLVKRGFLDRPTPGQLLYDKVLLFRPSALTEINYEPGCHSCRPLGKAVESIPSDLVLFHYAFVGFERTVKRYKNCAERLSPWNNRQRAGWHYKKNAQEMRRLFDERIGWSELVR